MKCIDPSRSDCSPEESQVLLHQTAFGKDKPPQHANPSQAGVDWHRPERQQDQNNSFLHSNTRKSNNPIRFQMDLRFLCRQHLQQLIHEMCHLKWRIRSGVESSCGICGGNVVKGRTTTAPYGRWRKPDREDEGPIRTTPQVPHDIPRLNVTVPPKLPPVKAGICFFCSVPVDPNLGPITPSWLGGDQDTHPTHMRLFCYIHSVAA